MFAPNFRSYEDCLVPVPADWHGDGMIAWDGLCGLAHEFAWSGSQTRCFEMAPGGALLGYTWFSKQLSHWSKCNGKAGVRRCGLTTKEDLHDFCFDGRIQQFPVCTTGQAGGGSNAHIDGRTLGRPEEPSPYLVICWIRPPEPDFLHHFW